MVKRGKIHAEISRELSGHIEAEFLSDALPDASDLCWENINSNLEGFYCTLIKKTYCDNLTKTKTGELWNIFKFMVMVFLRELRNARVG